MCYLKLEKSSSKLGRMMEFLGGLLVKGPALPLLWHGFYIRPRTSACYGHAPPKKGKTATGGSFNKILTLVVANSGMIKILSLAEICRTSQESFGIFLL